MIADGPERDRLADADHRQELDGILSRLVPVDAEERADADKARSWLRRGWPLWRVGHPGDPAAPSPHLVTYTVVVDADLGALCLVDNRRARRWLPAGGHVRPGERPLDAARRKLGEELGLDLPLLDEVSTDPLFLTVSETVGPRPHHDVGLWYVFAASVTTGMTWNQNQVVRTRWWTFSEIRTAHPSRLHPAVVRFLGKLESDLGRNRRP